MLRILTLVFFLHLSSVTTSSEVLSYARVSKNGQLARSSHDSFSWITRLSMKNNTSVENESKERSINDVVITVSPVYVPPRTPKLKKGEAVDYSITPKYSTLDNDMIVKLDATSGKKLIQHRFHPPVNFEHNIAYANGKPQKGSSNTESSLIVNSSTFLGPIFSGMYEYSPSEFLDDESLIPKPISKYPSTDDKKVLDSYKSPNKYHTGHETDYLSYDIPPSYENDELGSKPAKFVNYYDHSPSFMETEQDPYEHDFHHDIIYDNVPEYHHHETTTEEPEMNDERLDKRPYSYYFIGKKLWYIPLYFSIYFIIYIAALVLKSIARHKINFPANLAEAATHKRSDSSEGWWSFTEKILEGVERFAET
ncbi:uncharacterized protein LOC115240068 [Formica exsecta]|uniref:uncharacterized protein LOC115240068 n=1 Tax=Formica exsecta TaxID=72781 RepID=UPI001142495E|nr:uncharacterized protein LOC115240068 [Formica exsecta]